MILIPLTRDQANKWIGAHHRHNKPIVLLNVNGYWSHLVSLMDRIVEEGFMHHGHSALVTVVERPEDVIGAIEAELAAPKPPVVFKV